MTTARTCALVLYDTDTCQELVLAVLVRAHAALALYDADTCQQLVLAVGIALRVCPPDHELPGVLC